MVKSCIFFVFSVLIISCGVKTKYLKNNRTKVPFKNTFFKNKVLFNKSLLSRIDTNAIYIEEDQYKSSSDSFKKTEDFKDFGYLKDNYIGAYKFYSNGNVNYFVLNANYEIIKQNDLDPNFRGSRGVYYLKNNNI
jgi:hypothetical protein